MGDGRSEGAVTLLLLNGLPGVGKSSVATALAAGRPGTLVLDVDVVRTLISGDPAGTAEPARRLALDMARSHLGTGGDVVVPQLVARPDQVERFARAADDGGARFAHAVLEADPATLARRVADDDAAHRRGLDADAVAAYAAGLRAVATLPGVVRVDAGTSDVDAVAGRVRALLDG
ncbi:MULTISPECIES: AAA family ATPase [unclassified Isoptericola]|uniref:AAA family ATPase n=1 Tax=unclassified Isoptericola TaxID=2623355 RepID=UPI00365C28B7